MVDYFGSLCTVNVIVLGPLMYLVRWIILNNVFGLRIRWNGVPFLLDACLA
jgi:hypothetical protein